MVPAIPFFSHYVLVQYLAYYLFLLVLKSYRIFFLDTGKPALTTISYFFFFTIIKIRGYTHKGIGCIGRLHGKVKDGVCDFLFFSFWYFLFRTGR